MRRTEISGAAADAIRAHGGTALALQCDLGNASEVRVTVDAVLAEWGRIDAVFYNAAFYDHKNTDLDVDEASWQQAMDVNFGGAMALTRAVVPSMIARGGGAFVYNSSGASLQAEEIRPGYGISKSALNAMMRFVASRYGRDGIRANAILPFVYEGPGAETMASLNCPEERGRPTRSPRQSSSSAPTARSIITAELIHLDGGLSARAGWPTK